MDTTVILAQPRVSQLRAAAVYVDLAGSVDLGRSSAEIDSYQWGKFSRDPLNRGIRIGRFDAKFSPILVLDLGAQTAPRCPCQYRGVQNAKEIHWNPVPLCVWLLDTESHLRIGEKTLSSAKKRSQNALRPTDIPRLSKMQILRPLLDWIHTSMGKTLNALVWSNPLKKLP